MNNGISPQILSLQSVKKSYPQPDKTIEVLKEISFNFEAGSSYGLCGASGVGKSTILHILSGLDSPTKGSVRHLGLASDQKNHEIGFVFQQSFLINELTVIENILLKPFITGSASPVLKKEALALLRRMGLLEKAECYPGMLSGGEQQRVSLARALIRKPTFLLADEPTGSLDKENSRLILDLMLFYVNNYGMGLIISSHDHALLAQLDQVLELADGRIKKKEMNG